MKKNRIFKSLVLVFSIVTMLYLSISMSFAEYLSDNIDTSDRGVKIEGLPV